MIDANSDHEARNLTKLHCIAMAHEDLSMHAAIHYLLLAIVGLLSAVLRYIQRTLLPVVDQEEVENESLDIPRLVLESRLDPIEGTSRGETELVEKLSGRPQRSAVVGDDQNVGVVSMSQMSPRRYYAVVVGYRPGIYTSREDYEPQVTGFRGNKFKSFRTRLEAENYMVWETSQSSRTGGIRICIMNSESGLSQWQLKMYPMYKWYYNKLLERIDVSMADLIPMSFQCCSNFILDKAFVRISAGCSCSVEM